MQLIPCIEMLYKAEHPDFIERFRAARADGFDAVDMHLWRDKPLDAIVDVVAETGVRVYSFSVDPRRSLVDPAEQTELLAAVREAVPVARRLQGAHMILASGLALPGVAEAEFRAQAVRVLREACHIAEQGGATLLLEPVCMVIQGRPMAVRNIHQGLDLVEAVGHPALRLLADVFHHAADGQRLEGAFDHRLGLVGHVQVADLEGRHEPGTGHLSWSGLLPRLRAGGYTGPIGLEYLPSLPIADSLALVRRTLGLAT